MLIHRLMDEQRQQQQHETKKDKNPWNTERKNNDDEKDYELSRAR